MSELKAYKGDIYIPVYGSVADAKVYLKSEADKVIAHHKYKQCVAMAEMCEAECYYFNEREEHIGLTTYERRRWELFSRWRLKWAKLAKNY